MADWSGAFSTGSSGNPYQVSPLADQGFNDLFNTTRGMIPTGLDSLQSLIQGGMSSPLLAQIIQGALGRLAPAENQSRQAVTDAARAAGSLRSTAYGQSVANNENNILTNRSGLVSDMISKTLSTLVPGLLQEQKNSFMPSQSYMDLLKLIRPDVVANRGGSSGSYGGSSGGGLGPSIFDPGYDAMIADWQRRMNPTYGGGFAGTGVNTGAGAGGSNISGPAPNNPYGGYGLTGGGTGFYGDTPARPSGPAPGQNIFGEWVDAGPSSLVGYQQGYDEFGNAV
jgi:hypothetical protein